MSTRARLILKAIPVVEKLPPGFWLASRPLISGVLRAHPRLRGQLAAAMRAGLGDEHFDPRFVDAYFRHVADLAAHSAIIFREQGPSAALRRCAVHDDASAVIYKSAFERGKGIIMVGGHLMGHEVLSATCPPEYGMTVMVRQAPDPAYEAIKQRWYASLGLTTVHRPSKRSDSGGLQEITAALRVLRANRVLAITPDLIRKPGTGVPVRFLGRVAHLPAGAFFLAWRSGAALIPTFATEEAGVYRIWCHPPLEPDPGLDRDAAVAALAQEWATLFEAFIRERPDLWQFWMDKRWRQWLGV